MKNKKIVIDACVARSAGNTNHPVSTACRKFIKTFVLKTNNELVFTKEIKQEWDKHESNLSRKFRFILKRKGRIKNIKSYSNQELRKIIKHTKDEGRIEAILKDIFLVEAALKTDKCVISKDKKARNHFAYIADTFKDLKFIIWVNPVNDEVDPINWLLNGCANMKVNTLKNYSA